MKMPESKFMKEWKKSYASSKSIPEDRICGNEMCRRFNILAEILDKCLIEIESDIKMSNVWKPEIDKAFVEKEIDEIYLEFERTCHFIHSTAHWKDFIREIIKRVIGWKR